MEPKFDCSPPEREAAARIAKRAYALRKAYAARGTGRIPSALSMQMDLVAAHANGCPLDFQRLENADDFNLLHDVLGIERHLNRVTGQLAGFFLPRFAAKAQEPLPTDSPRVRETIAAKREAFEQRKGRKRGGGNSRRGRAARRAKGAA
jgi:hypothetical protein